MSTGDGLLNNKRRLALFLEAAGRILRINQGDLKLKGAVPGATWNNTYAGDVHYVDSDGWLYVVFNDCGSFDYIDRVVPPDGREPLDFSEMHSGIIQAGREGETAIWPSYITNAWLDPDKDQLKFWGVADDGMEDVPGWWS